MDLLGNFIFLEDCHNNRILDMITSLSAPAQTVSNCFPRVKPIGSSIRMEDLFAEFPDLTLP